jgi:CheY-like chemotaxis protein
MPRAGPKVLIADDSPVARYMVTRRLQNAGFEVIELESASPPPAETIAGVACALLDLDLGRSEDGRELASSLRAMRPDLPIAFFSGSTSPEVLERARVFGPVFAKPGELEQAMEWVGASAG